MYPDETSKRLPKTERQLINHIDELLDHFGVRSLEETIKVSKTGKKKRCYNLSKKVSGRRTCVSIIQSTHKEVKPKCRNRFNLEIVRIGRTIVLISRQCVTFDIVVRHNHS